jgi:hypothetical protein
VGADVEVRAYHRLVVELLDLLSFDVGRDERRRLTETALEQRTAQAVGGV